MNKMQPEYIVYDLINGIHAQRFIRKTIRAGYDNGVMLMFSPSPFVPSRNCPAFSKGNGPTEGILFSDNRLYVFRDLDGNISSLDKLAREFELPK